MERTEGKMVSSIEFPNLLQIKNNTILCVFPNNCKTATEILLQKANIKHTKKCWNAFEKGGSYDALLEACKEIKTHTLNVREGNPRFLLRLIQEITEQAISLAEKEGK